MAEEDAQLANENWMHYVYARDNGHLDYVLKAELCEQYFYGAQWDEKVKQALKAQGKPVLTINKTYSTLITLMGEYLKNIADIRFMPVDDLADPETAEIIDKLFLHTLNSNHYDQLEASLFDDGIISSRGFLDLRVNFDNNLRGEADLSLLNPKNVIVDPDADSYDPDDWSEVFISKWMTPNDISMKYGSDAAEDLKNKARADFQYGIDSVDELRNSFGGKYNARRQGVTNGVADKDLRRFIRVVERQFKKLKRVEFFVDRQTGDMREVPETWDRNRIAEVVAKYDLAVLKKDAEKIQWRVSADNLILHNEESPLKHFTPIPFFPVFHRGFTIGAVENIISPQDYLNKTTSQELHVVNTTANSGWQMEEDQLVNMDPNELEQRGAETGLVLVRKKGTDKLEKIQPNQVPTGLDRIAYKSDEFIKEISGVSDSARGFDRADVAAKAIQYKQQVGGITNAKVLANLSQTRKLLARNMLDIYQEFYTEERIIRVTGKNTQTTTKPQEFAVNQVTPEGTVVNDLTIGKYDVIMVDAPDRDSAEDTLLDEAIKMRELGIAIPDHIIVEASRLPHKREIVEQIKEATGAGESSEAELRAAELEMQLKELEAQEKVVSIRQKEAEAKYTEARAAKTVVDAQVAANPDNGERNQQMVKMAQEMENERFKIAEEMKLRREELQAEIQLKREEMQQTMQIKRAEAAANMEIKEEQAKQAAKNKPAKPAKKVDSE